MPTSRPKYIICRWTSRLQCNSTQEEKIRWHTAPCPPLHFVQPPAAPHSLVLTCPDASETPECCPSGRGRIDQHCRYAVSASPLRPHPPSPCVLGHQHLEVSLRLLNTLAAAQAPTLRQPVNNNRSAPAASANLHCMYDLAGRHLDAVQSCHDALLTTAPTATHWNEKQPTCVCGCPQGRQGGQKLVP